MLDDSLKSRDIDSRYIRKFLPAGYKFTSRAKTKKIQIKHDDSADQKIISLQTEVERLRTENEFLGQPFVARGLLSVDSHHFPVKTLVNSEKRAIQKSELDHESFRKMLKGEARTKRKIDQEVLSNRSRT